MGRPRVEVDAYIVTARRLSFRSALQVRYPMSFPISTPQNPVSHPTSHVHAQTRGLYEQCSSGIFSPLWTPPESNTSKAIPYFIRVPFPTNSRIIQPSLLSFSFSFWPSHRIVSKSPLIRRLRYPPKYRIVITTESSLLLSSQRPFVVITYLFEPSSPAVNLLSNVNN